MSKIRYVKKVALKGNPDFYAHFVLYKSGIVRRIWSNQELPQTVKDFIASHDPHDVPEAMNNITVYCPNDEFDEFMKTRKE